MKKDKNEIIIIGLGKFGMAAAKALSRYDCDVLAIDKSTALVDEVAPYVTHAAVVNAMDKETEERLTAVEMKLAYMEDFVSQIQGVAVEQAKTIDKLQKEIKLMSEKIREMSNAVEGDIPNRRPPHY